MGACPGNEESAGVNYSHRCPKGNRQMRRVLNQAANAAVKAKGTIFAVVYRRLVPRLGHAQTIGAITHRLCRLIWKILHQRVRYEERGPAVSAEAQKVRARDDPTTPRPGLPRRADRTYADSSVYRYNCGAAIRSSDSRKVKAPHVLKVDVEGAELLVLNGLRDTLACRSFSMNYITTSCRNSVCGPKTFWLSHGCRV
jgi:hypothetical protein